VPTEFESGKFAGANLQLNEPRADAHVLCGFCDSVAASRLFNWHNVAHQVSLRVMVFHQEVCTVTQFSKASMTEAAVGEELGLTAKEAESHDVH